MNNTVVHVPETGFGRWFLRTDIWAQYVLSPAIDQLEKLMPQRPAANGVIVDLGCGSGRALTMLAQRYAPQRLIGIDIDAGMLAIAARRAARDGVHAEFLQGAISQLALPDGSVDMVFCHQTFHHLVEQEEALREIRRVLKPGGMLLFAESTRRYIHSLPIRLLFRHPMHLQRSANEYLALVRAAGFTVPDSQVSRPYSWWSRSDIGIGQYIFRIMPRPRSDAEETLISLVGLRPVD